MNKNNQKQTIKEIKQALPNIDILGAIGLDIETAGEEVLKAAALQLHLYIKNMETQYNKIALKLKDKAINNQAHDEFVIGLGLDGTVETSFERKECFKVNVKAMQQAAGIQYTIDSVADPELAKLTPIVPGYRRKDTISEYKNGNTKVIPFVTDYSHDQLTLNIKLGGTENE